MSIPPRTGHRPTGLERLIVDGNDVEAVRDLIAQRVARARRGEGPSIVEALTYRLRGHSLADPAAYRPSDEVEQWAGREPVGRYRSVLTERGADPARLDEVAKLVDQAAERALSAALPAAESAWTDVWADGTSAWRN